MLDQLIPLTRKENAYQLILILTGPLTRYAFKFAFVYQVQ